MKEGFEVQESPEGKDNVIDFRNRLRLKNHLGDIIEYLEEIDMGAAQLSALSKEDGRGETAHVKERNKTIKDLLRRADDLRWILKQGRQPAEKEIGKFFVDFDSSLKILQEILPYTYEDKPAFILEKSPAEYLEEAMDGLEEIQRYVMDEGRVQSHNAPVFIELAKLSYPIAQLREDARLMHRDVKHINTERLGALFKRYEELRAEVMSLVGGEGVQAKGV